ncbi:MAG: hypothetical protein J6R52_04665 [Alphaproteobacteria bacterium]|nr:hypothetical protein [Alphaproteobacteria bacterium]
MEETNQFLSQTFRLLKNSGFHNLRADSEFIYMEDPSCILRSFETFLEYAWVIITILAGILLFGWAISMIRGAKYDNIFINMRNLILIFGGLSLTKPVINLVYGDDLFARGCGTISISIDEIKKLLDARNSKLKKYDQNQLYEDLIIQDSGVVIETGGTTTETTSESLDEILEQTETIAPEEQQKSAPTDYKSVINISGTPQSATETGNDVIYTMPDGTKIKRSGGTRSWRNSNPGNIRYSKFAQNVGAIGQAGGFAVFPNEQVGMYAIEALLRTDSYNKLTLAGAISRYAPPVENNTAAYHRNIEKLTGLSINKKMSDLTPSELTKVAQAIRQIENWKAGTTQRI